MPEQTNLSPEARALLELYALQTNAAVASIARDVRDQVDKVRDNLERRIDSGTRDIKDGIAEIKTEQSAQRIIIEQQGKDLTEVKTRLNEGDKRFDRNEEQAANTQERNDSRLKALEDSDKKQSNSLSYIAGAGAGGGIIGAALSKIIGG